jgi:peptidoglycan/LPS O-acetylase OafA/YrhL
MQLGSLMERNDRLSALDGWRAISIILVLSAHLLPLGPKMLRLNEASGAMGMALFFTLSGFLITRLLINDSRITSFLIKRFFRIIPLAWLAITIVLLTAIDEKAPFLPQYFFYANLAHDISLPEGLGHFWSLNVEVQFYCAIAVLFLFFGRRAAYLLPIACITITVYRIKSGAHIDINTLRRVDEILAGCVLSLIFSKVLGEKLTRLLTRSNTYLAILFFLACSHPESGFLNYFRPYAAALVIGSTLYGQQKFLDAMLASSVLRYIATISFALYVTHGVLMNTWFASGEKWVKYAKRPLLLVATFLISHISTFYFERHFIALGNKLSSKIQPRKKSSPD